MYAGSPSRVLVKGFAVVIFIGSILLSLPVSTQEESLPYLDALFTATSAVCVTGLVVVDTGTTFSLFGQTVIMILIFLGSLGFMTMATFIFILLGRKITLRDQLVVKESLHTETFPNIKVVVSYIVKLSVISQFIGASLLAIRFVPQMGWGQGLYFSLFHAVSAFGNAGFDIVGNYRSLTPYAEDYLVTGVIAALFILGGLGFFVVIEIMQRKKLSRFSLHTKMVVTISLVLLIVATFLVLLLEYDNQGTLGALEWPQKIWAAFFTAATPRTAGFNVVPTETLNVTTLFFILILMFIGASPASTGGGIKTTTFGALMITVIGIVKGDNNINIWERKLSMDIALRSLAIIVISLAVILSVIFLLSLSETADFLLVVFEAFSAFGTVGLSMGITPDLSSLGKVIIIITMFVGRLGPLTIAFALARQQPKTGISYPEERIMVG